MDWEGVWWFQELHRKNRKPYLSKLKKWLFPQIQIFYKWGPQQWLCDPSYSPCWVWNWNFARLPQRNWWMERSWNWYWEKERTVSGMGDFTLSLTYDNPTCVLDCLSERKKWCVQCQGCYWWCWINRLWSTFAIKWMFPSQMWKWGKKIFTVWQSSILHRYIQILLHVICWTNIEIFHLIYKNCYMCRSA